MDWNSKTTRDVTEFEHEVVHNVDAVDASSNFGGTRIKGNFSVDLKLGQVNNSAHNSLNKLKETGITKMESSPSGSSKRARAANNGSHTVSCLVDGCDTDLSNCRDYHRRHKVCELHSKTPQVMVGGQKQRFCQQCSRFHSLEEFDEGKRSCRKRLDGHNRRRRKPQPDPLSRSGGFLSNYQGAQLLPFSSSHMYSSATVVSPTCAGVVNSEADARHYNQHQHLNLPDKQNLFLGSSPKGGKALAFLQGDNPIRHSQTSPKASVSISQCLLWTAVLSETSGASHNMYYDRSTTRDSDCALSLLSSPSTQSQTSGISLSHMVQSLGTCLNNHCIEPMESVLVSSGRNANRSMEPLVQSSGTSLYNHSIEPVESVLVTSGRDANVNCPGMFHLGSDESAANNVPQAIPFQWE